MNELWKAPKQKLRPDHFDVAASKFYDWREHYGKVNEHNGWVPRDEWSGLLPDGQRPEV